MEIQIADPRIFVLDKALTLEEAETRAASKRFAAVSTGLGALILRLKPEEIVLVAHQKRFEPFWHVAGTVRYVSDRSRENAFPVSGKEVRLVTDAVTGNLIPDSAPLLLNSRSEITDLEALSHDDAIVVVPRIHASSAVSRLLPMLIKTVRADVLNEQTINVDTLNLCYRQVWALEFQQKSRNTRGVVEVDAVTGQRRIRQSLMPKPTGMISKAELLNVGTDVIGMIAPGGNITVGLSRLMNRLPGNPTTEPPEPD